MKYGLIAERVGHSFSADIHKRLFGYDYELKAISRDSLDEFLKTREFDAINVTIPYKEAVIPFLDYVNPKALEIGAVNTVVKRGGKLYGYNTDFMGMLAMIRREGIELSGKKFLVLGSGGTSKTAMFVARELGCVDAYRVSRSGRDGCITYENARTLHSDAEVIINTTPCGMFPETGVAAVDVNDYPRLEAVVDAVYNPLRSKLVTDALNKGVKAVGGLYMLVAQAAYAAELFVDKTVEKERVDEIFRDMLAAKQNVVIVGMPGCGKTSTGRLIAEALGFEFVDTDKEIQARTGRTPNEIITESGEPAFRDIESEVIKDVSKLQSRVISTGGGAILRKENIDNLRSNGRIYFLDRDIEHLCITSDRPLSSTYESLKKRYDERYEIYCSCCDKRIVAVDGKQLNANAILEDLKYENSCN
ncbi:MAG: AAA family ATPase [Clostridia bacterium]|nr:AAA family ATPase [Clostridia bacterium]